MKNRGWRNQRGLVRAGKRRRRKAKRAQESLRVVEPEAIDEADGTMLIKDIAERQSRADRIALIKGIAERRQRRRYELQKKI